MEGGRERREGRGDGRSTLEMSAERVRGGVRGRAENKETCKKGEE